MFRPRVVAAIGSFLSGLGLILSSMSNQLWQIIIAYGLVGLGLGFINPSSFLAVNSYFSSKRGRAIGLALAGKYFSSVLFRSHGQFFLFACALISCLLEI